MLQFFQMNILSEADQMLVHAISACMNVKQLVVDTEEGSNDSYKTDDMVSTENHMVSMENENGSNMGEKTEKTDGKELVSVTEREEMKDENVIGMEKAKVPEEQFIKDEQNKIKEIKDEVIKNKEQSEVKDDKVENKKEGELVHV